jgi:uncharacterized UPF0160 family protein
MEKLKLITHNGSFHADDVFAAATIILYLEKKPALGWEIIRTRDEEIIKKGDFVFDVGLVYDKEKNRFDHHQIGGAGNRPARNAKGIASAGGNGIEYASFGLVWDKYGQEVCGSREVADFLEKKIVQPIDAGDNGIDLIELKTNIRPYFLQTFLKLFIPSWKNVDEESLLVGFLEAVNFAKNLLRKEIELALDYKEGEEKVKDFYQKAEDKRVVVLDQKYPWLDVATTFPETLFVVFPRLNDETWGAEGVFVGLPSFEKRKNFPESWAGLKDEALEKETGVEGAVFCHRGRFMVVAKTKEAILQLVNKALEA